MNEKPEINKVPASFLKLKENKTKVYTRTGKSKVLESNEYTINRFYKPIGNI